MRNWRELGEVPDSDDESFDDVDDDQLPENPSNSTYVVEDMDVPAPNKTPKNCDMPGSDDALALNTQLVLDNDPTAPEEPNRHLENADIWNVPTSSPDELHLPRFSSGGGSNLPTPTEPCAKASSLPSTPVRDIGGSCSAISPQGADEAPPLYNPAAIGRRAFPEDDISTSYVRLTTLPPDSSPLSTPPRSSPPEPPRSPIPLQTRPTAPKNRGIPVDEDIEISRQASVRLERSLRPRKPIQQHPYLLENAQYSNFMKSHGVKPVKVTVDPALAKSRDGEDDSQEQDFEADESQPTASQQNGDKDTEESVPTLFDNDGEVDDRDELAPSPSPLKTSPWGHQLRASSQPTDADHTDLTTFSEDDEFPPLDRIPPQAMSLPKRRPKRQSSQLLSSRRKRQNRLPGSSQASSPIRKLILPAPSMWDLSPSPPEFPEQHHEPSQILGNTSPIPSLPASLPRPLSSLPSPITGTINAPIPVEEDDVGDTSDSDSASSTHSAASGSEVVRQNVRRIRGVLPASWLRLDQQKHKPAVHDAGRSPEPAPSQAPKRGVALPKQSSSRPPNATPFRLDDFDESDEEPMREQPIFSRPPLAPPPIAIYDDDDGASVMEEDFIDPMMPGGRKRPSSLNLSGRAKRQKKDSTNSIFSGHSGKPRQPRITEILGRSKSTASAALKRMGSGQPRRKKRSGNSTKHNSRERAATPPLLSILDVMEPVAPEFVRIAARAVKRKKDLGRGSPTRKMISLATRGDNVDALSSLRDWKAGRTRPNISVQPSRRLEPPRTRPALQEVSTNPRPSPSQARPRHPGSFPQRLAKQSNLDEFVTVDGDAPPTSMSAPAAVKLLRRKPLYDSMAGARPAQLETEVLDTRRKRLGRQKRSLNAFYMSLNVPPSAIGRQDQTVALELPVLQEVMHQRTDDSLDNEVPPATEANGVKAKSRFRKRRLPRHIDPEAPQYTRANDPLSVDAPIMEDVAEPQCQDKLVGLGPYGSHYTHHFDVFPLDQGVFFHESTVIGRGSVRKAREIGHSGKIRRHRPAISFLLDGQNLRWGAWDDKSSSELGILSDWIAEQLSCLSACDAANPRTVEGASFIVDYIVESLSVQNDDAERAFTSRSLEVFSSFAARLESLDWNTVTEACKKAHLQVATRFSIAVLAIWSLCQAPGGDAKQGLEVENLLKRLASVTVKGLLSDGLDELRTLYGELQRSAFRERGIRGDQVLANCWVVVMRVLESANIPRSSFWDVTHTVMLSPAVVSGSDSQSLERLWQDMFTLLPLGEFDNEGILVPGSRKTSPLEGWKLPQQLLKRVFQLYKSKTRQSPSFNEYCRALVARCHFLVQQWGWYNKCTGIIGVIFDFFGSEDLAHLRNEEVYKSPRFLEELGSNPSLSIEPEDRCFHIFVKILALAIQRLKQLGRLNDIKNLVARTLPNHDRQHLKEDTVHERDLAALRNHHDLLCTLFWAAPPELRPAVHLVEKLVVPGTAHKEACLINLRAWNQLARFVASTDENGAEFRPFVVWINNIFNQTLEQYLSAASDIEQQFRTLSNETPGLASADARDDMIARNKATAMDVLHFSVKASLDVLKHSQSFEATTCALNITQLQKVFTSLDLQSPKFDWAVVRVALETLEHYFGSLDKVSEEQYSSGLNDEVDPQHIEDAILLFNEKLVKDFFWMGRTIIGLPTIASFGKRTDHGVCVEKTVALSARIAARFIKNGLTRLSRFFQHGKYCLFSDMPKNLNTPARRYLPLFVAGLLKSHVFDFKDIDTSTLELWVLSIAKPFRLLGYESFLAEVLKNHGIAFMERVTVVGVTPDYNFNLDMFASAIRFMRKSLREAGGSAQSRQLRADYSKILQLAMQKMKEDLTLLRGGRAEHAAYIDFVRQVISLIKSHGVNICVVDPFFTQPSTDYTPSMQDPQLHTAGIMAYGVRLGESDARAAPQLFHYLYNNFKIALGNDRLAQERGIIAEAMRKDPHVVTFMLSLMIPAVVRACAQVEEAWLLLEVYVNALADVLDAACVPRELVGSDVEHAAEVLRAVVAWFEEPRDAEVPSLRQVHLMGLLARVVDVLQPSLRTALYCPPGTESIQGVGEAVEVMERLMSEARDVVGDMLAKADISREAEIPSELKAVLVESPANVRVQEFVRLIVTDVRRTWVVTEGCVTVQMAVGGRMGTQSATQSGMGIKYGPWQKKELWTMFYGLAKKWDLEGTVRVDTGRRERKRARRRGLDPGEMFF
ncbi:Mus7/MMS22 family-domain-containing protein [Lasiosphaeria hispida]|uniref:Mus7/MMS22 family-domain-containing protein n=1 Tax=Lasiosphaeria hispida TaxID=260671 RepID=A0AAJ0M9E3_9PEZI|nr:Mus7/MMS22 family-domain-containing protein [Lasiosphaeria hispida]